MTLLGGHAIYLSPADIKLGEREKTEDIAQVLSRMADLIMARVFGHDIVEELARHSRVPVINWLSDLEHPCQILADLLTIEEKKQRLAGMTLAYVGDGNNVCHSLMYGAALTGMHFVAACPPAYVPRRHITDDASALARQHGGSIRIVNDPREAARGADVLYTDVWASMGQEAEAELRKKAFHGFQINAGLLAAAHPQAIVMHCLPAHYGDEIDYDVARTPNSVIFDQAENRLHAQNGLMVLLAGG
jgi:ornithine carbamoyltransferase